jgi:tRNA(fMet)-specific endonuclease VapC
MKAFDADILTLHFMGDPVCVLKTALIPADELSVTIVAAEEVLRGRLSAIRQAQAGNSKRPLDVYYQRLERTLIDLRRLTILSHSPQAEGLVQSWRKQKIKVGISDLRIAAICVIHGATLISRNRRDFDQVPVIARRILVITTRSRNS